MASFLDESLGPPEASSNRMDLNVCLLNYEVGRWFPRHATNRYHVQDVGICALCRSPPHTTSDMMDAPWLSNSDGPSTSSTAEAPQPVRQCSLPTDQACLVKSSDNNDQDEPRDLPCISAKVQSAGNRRNVLKRAMTLPVQSEAAEEQPLLQLGPSFNYAPLRSPMRTSSKPLVPNSETSETLLDVPILVASTASTASEAACSSSTTLMPAFEIPTFTVTINPLESNEMTFVPGSPPSVNDSNQSSGANSGEKAAGHHEQLLSEEEAKRRILANTTVIVDDEVKNNLLMLNNGQVLHTKNTLLKKPKFDPKKPLDM